MSLIDKNNSELYSNEIPVILTIFSQLKYNLKEQKKKLTNIALLLRHMETKINQIIKLNKKSFIKKNIQNTGLTKKVEITQELSSFLNINKNTNNNKLSRTFVTKFISNYIKENNLQDINNKRIIVPNKELKVLLDYNDTNKNLTFFNIQKLLKKHFIN